MFSDMDETRAKLLKALENAGLSLSEVSLRIGKNRAYVHQFIHRNTPKKLPEDVRRDLSHLSGLSERDLGGDVRLPRRQPLAAGRLSVRGQVRAGAWLDIDIPMDEGAEGEIPIGPDARYPVPQYALQVVGTSMNKFVDDGHFVIVASWPELGRDLRENEVVVVRRERAKTYEVTLKRARKAGKNWELWPDSSDPRWQEPVRFDEKDVTCTVIGLVVGVYRPI
jgi:SOS-response transcriptional repressor LexA